jgi:hypothetical protein
MGFGLAVYGLFYQKTMLGCLTLAVLQSVMLDNRNQSMNIRNKYGHATTIKNNRTGKTGMLLEKWPYFGPENDWQETIMYRILMNGGRYKYILENDLNRLYTKVKPD